jgi:hypothetical protein
MEHSLDIMAHHEEKRDIMAHHEENCDKGNNSKDSFGPQIFTLLKVIL